VPKVTIKARTEEPVDVRGKFLSIINADAEFKVESLEIGSLVGEVGRQFELDTIRAVNFVNDTDVDIDVSYETSNIKVHTSGKGVVTVGNEVVVKRIVEAIQVNASATVEDGKMSKKVSNAFLPIDTAKISIAAGATIEVFTARASLNRKVTLQLITDIPNMSEIRIGNSAENTTATKGIFLQGHKDAPSAYQWETETAVFVHNPNATAIDLAGGEEWRA
jgi:hypothetical protein